MSKMKKRHQCSRSIILHCWPGLVKNDAMPSMNSLHASVDFIPVADQPPETEDEKQLDKTATAAMLSNKETKEEFQSDKWGARHTMVFLASFGLVLLVTMRINLSIAIVAMVGKPRRNNTDLDLDGTCPVNSLSNDTTGDTQEREFDWDERTQGMVLGAYFYGNILTNIIGGRVAEHKGGKFMLGMGVFLSAISTLFSPLAARTSTKLFMVARLLTGVVQGFALPALTRCLVTWVPPAERSKFNTVVFSGSEVGIVVTLAMGGWLCGLDFLGGWPLVFYVFGFLGLAWSLAWFLLHTERPEDHPRISDAEKKYILATCRVKRGKPISIPWLAVLRSVPVWALTVMHIGHNWGYYTFITLLPSYLSNIQHFELKSNGMLSALPYALKWGFALIYGFIVNKFITTGKVSVLLVRKLSMMLGSYIPALGLLILSMTGCDQVAAVAILCISTALSGAVFCGFFCSHQDLCPNLTSTLYGFTNTLANSTGFIAPALAGAILHENQTLRAWNTVFYISAGVYTFSCTVYSLFISTEVQPFNNPKPESSPDTCENEKLKGPDKC